MSVGERLLSPPRGWPESFSSEALQTFLSSLGGTRVRLCASPAEPLSGLEPEAASDSLQHALAVRRRKGWPVVGGYAVFERAERAGSFVATERFWNSKGKAGVWYDGAARTSGHGQLVLVEVPAMLSRVPEPEAAETASAQAKGRSAKPEAKYYGGTGASTKKAIERAEKRDAMMIRRIDKAINTVLDTVADSMLKEAIDFAGTMIAEEREAARVAEVERFEKEQEEREYQLAEAERRRAREERRREEAANAPSKAEAASCAAVKELKARGGVEVCWDVGLLLSVLSPYKDAGAKCFGVSEYAAALATYRSAITASQDERFRAWQPVEALLLACHANAALCLLRLHEPLEAVAECEKALELPLANACGRALLSKLLLRKTQGLLDACDDAAGDCEAVRNVDDLRDAAVATLLEASRRGLLDTGAPAAKEFSEQASRLPCPLPPPSEADHEARMPLHEVCEVLLGGFHDDPPRNAEQIDELVEGLAAVLNNRSMQPPSPCATDATSGISLLWALSIGIERFPTEATCDFFERAVDLLVHHASIDQRVPVDMRLPCISSTPSHTALMQASAARCPSAVRKLLSLGADPRLRDERGATALIHVCMADSGTASNAAAEIASLLIDAGALIDAQDLAGQSALMHACSSAHAELISCLLTAGARVDLRAATGRSAIAFLAAARWGGEREATVHQEFENKLMIALPAPLRAHADNELRTMRFFDMLERVLAPVNNKLAGAYGGMDGKRKGEQEDAVLRTLFKHIEMDPSVLDMGRDGSLPGKVAVPLGNFLEELHDKAVGMLPAALTTTFLSQPSDDELALITQHSRDAIAAAEKAATAAHAKTGGVRTIAYHHATLCSEAMMHYRHRGRMARRMIDGLDLVVRPIRRGISHAVPSREALVALRKLGPIVECGAGSGYWSRQLLDRGVDAIAFDIEPPTGAWNNDFAGRSFCRVERADCATLFTNKPDLATRALLLVWPNSNYSQTDVDAAVEPPWDARCLSSYIKAGGRVVAYAGEREEEIEHIPGMPMDAGISASSEFQALLRSKFRLSSVIPIRQLPYTLDDLSIWERKA